MPARGRWALVGVDVALDADNPLVGELVIVARLDAAETAGEARVGGAIEGREVPVGAAVEHADAGADEEAGPVVGATIATGALRAGAFA